MLRLIFTGDIFPGDESFTSGFGLKSKTNEKNLRVWDKNIREVVGEADYIIGNLESPLVDDRNARGRTFYGLPLFADLLRDSGINVLNVANNHIMEHGAEGFTYTLATLHKKRMQTIGEMEKGVPKILTIKNAGTTICMAGFCDEHVCSLENPGCFAGLDDQNVLDTLQRMKQLHPDLTVFVFHWGNEYTHIPSLAQRKLAYKLIENGADLIIGHHPHVIQPYEQYRQGHIIYSLGNFCFDDVQSEHFARGMIANVCIQERAIDEIRFEGLLLQDQAYSDELVKPMDEQVFKNYFKRINDEYARIQHLADKDYQELYKERQQRAHTKERILMRLSMAAHLFNVHHRHRKQLLKNLKNYLIKL